MREYNQQRDQTPILFWWVRLKARVLHWLGVYTDAEKREFGYQYAKEEIAKGVPIDYLEELTGLPYYGPFDQVMDDAITEYKRYSA